MDRRTRKRLTVFAFMLLVTGSLIAALWQYHQMVVAVYDGATASVYRRMLRPFSEPRDTVGQEPISIALFRSASANGAGGGQDDIDIKPLVRQWSQVLSGQGFHFRRIDRLESIADLEDFNLLVLPAALHLPDRESQVIQQFVRQGNGVVLTWAAGSRDSRGQWQPSQVLQRLAGMDLDVTPPPPDMETGRVYLALDPQSPLSRGIEPGFMLSLSTFDQPLSATVREPRMRAAGDWRFDRRPVSVSHVGLDGRQARQRAAIVLGDYFEGRVVWLGFTIASGGTEPLQQLAFQQLIYNIVAWTTRQPMAWKPDWPESVDSAFALAWRLARADDFDARLPALAASYQAPLTTYVSPQLLTEDPEKVRLLSQGKNRIALLVPVHDGDTDASPPDWNTLQTWRRRLESVNQNAPSGCLVPLEALSADWLDALVEAGFDYVVSPDVMHLLPRVVRSRRTIPVLARPHELWMLPDTPVRTAVAAMTGTLATGLSGDDAALGGLADLLDPLGGLLHLSVSAEDVDDAFLSDLDRLLANIKRRRVWIASCADILAFYRIWGHVTVNTEYPTPNRFVIKVSNSGVRAASDLPVFIQMPSARQELSVTPTTLGTPPVQATSRDGRIWRFDVDRIPAGKNFIYHLYRFP